MSDCTFHARLREKLAPYEYPHRRLMRVLGVNWITAAIIIAAIGVDMTAFPGASHLASWTGICPGNHQSAGKRKTGKLREGNVQLKTALVTAAVTVAKTRRGYLGEKHPRLRAWRGEARAASAGYGLRGRYQAESRLMGRKAHLPRSPRSRI